MSALNLNKVTLAGHLTNAPELKQTSSGISVVSFTIAVNRRVKNEVDFISCVAWRNTAEFVCNYFKAGSGICIVGSIQTRSWSDNNGNKRYATEVVADEAYFVDSKAETPSNEYLPTSTVNEPQNANFSPAEIKFDEISDDSDDLPF